VRGVVHSAGVLDDALLGQQTWERFEAVLAPKLSGGSLLDSLTRGTPLDFFVLFSSVASVLGAPGQANHAAANAYLDTLAHARRRQGLPATSINWGAWAEVGSAAERGTDRRLARRGVELIQPEAGLRVLEQILARDLVQVAVVPGRVLAPGDAQAQPLLAALERPPAAPAADSAAATAPGQSQVSLRERLGELPLARRREMVLSYTRERAGRVLCVDSAELRDSVPLKDLGLDSLMAVELRNLLSSELGLDRPLPATLVFDYPSIGAIGDLLLRELDGDTTSVVQERGGRDVLDEVEELSDAEVERLLAERGVRRG
jgi:acyl carrier protein